MNEFQRITGVLLDPKPAFADIAARPRWWVPVLILVLLAMTLIYGYSHRVGWETLMRQQMEHNSQFEQMSAEQRDRMIETQSRVAGTFGFIGAAVGFPVYMLALSGILLLIFKVMLGGNLGFKQLFAICSYSMVPGIISSALAILVLYMKAPEDFDLRNPLAFNVGAFLASDSPAWLKSLGQSIDLFTIWSMLLMATGISMADRKLSWGKCVTWILVSWLVWVLGKTGIAALMG